MEEYSLSKVSSKFNKQQKIVVAKVAKSGKDWGIPDKVVTDTVAIQPVYTPLYDASVNPMTKSKGTTIARDACMNDIFHPALDIIYTKYLLNNPLISAEDKAAMGIHSPNVNRKPTPDVDTSPIMKVTNGESLYQIFMMRNAVTNRIGKPKGVFFCEIWYKIGGDEPTDFSDTTKKRNLKNSGSSIVFDMADKGKMVYYFARWVMKSGAWGPWTKVFNCIIA